MTEGEVLAEFVKNSRERVLVRRTQYNGRELLDVRAFYQAGEEWRPGRGLSLRVEQLADLRRALNVAAKALASQSNSEKG